MINFTKRSEIKFFLTSKYLKNFYEWLDKNNAQSLYPDRFVSSTYFDNNQFKMFDETREGISPRRKFRIRCYSKHIDGSCHEKHWQEEKYTTAEGRYKKSQVFSINELMFNGFFLENYGLIFPKVNVTYLRSYFTFSGYRLTLDRQISYRNAESFSSTRYIYDPDMILELKTGPDVDMNQILSIIRFPLIHFSKYERAVNSIYTIF